jgi:hypothetical protein
MFWGGGVRAFAPVFFKLLSLTILFVFGLLSSLFLYICTVLCRSCVFVLASH